MKLVVPAVFQRDFLDAVAQFPIDHLYGAMGGDVGLRAQQWLPQPKAGLNSRPTSNPRTKKECFIFLLPECCLSG